MERKLKILFVVDQFYSASTPFILNQITGMIDRGHEIFILAREKGNMTEPHTDVLKYNLAEKYFVLDEINNTGASRIGYFFKNAFLFFFYSPVLFFRSVNIFKYGSYAFTLRLFHEANSIKKLKQKEYDIIHAQFGPLGKMMVHLKDMKMVKGKLVTQFRGYDVSKLINFEGIHFYDLLFKKGDYFLANCKYFYDKIIRLGAPSDRSYIQFSGVKSAQFLNTERTDLVRSNVLRLGTVARLSEKKGIEYILQALKILKEKKIKFKYQLVGDGELKERIVQLIAKYDLTNEVQLLGSQNHDFIRAFLKGTDIFISHNITAENGDEDAPVNTLKEAMLSGAVVISTFHGGIPELVKNKENGFLVQERDAPHLAEVIVNIEAGQFDLKKIIASAKKTVAENFDNDKLNEDLEKRYCTFLK